MDFKAKILCYGETLWDVFPEGARIGGAPLNVAYHLHRLGMDAKIISRIGKDKWGEKLKKQVRSWGLQTDTLQEDKTHDTSIVRAHVQNDGETTYEIVAPVAWDFIAWEEDFSDLVENAGAVVFGSLAFRSPDSRKTLFRIIENADFTVYDVNFRPPYYDREMVIQVLRKTDFLKLNHEELSIIADWIGVEKEPEEKQVESLRQEFSIHEILVTKGSKGAHYFSEELKVEVKAFPVEVINTVGSGDAFLAAFLSGKFGEQPTSPREQLEKAALLGAFVAGKDGACPTYNKTDLQRFKKQG